MKRPQRRFWACVLFTVLCFAVGGISGWLQTSALREWYPLLEKSPLTPPGVVFPIAWSVLYLCIGVAGGLTATSGSSLRRPLLRLWTAQLAFNFAWSVLFFTFRNPLLGLLDLLTLDVLVACYLLRALRHERPAGWLFLPYLLWLLFATYLNGYVLVANGTGF